MKSHLFDKSKNRPAGAPRSHSILLIDDDEAMVEVLSYRLTQQGFRVLHAETGSEGLVVAHEQHPAAVVLDLRLPDTDGLTVCQRMADDPETAAIPVIILSAMERPDIIRRSRAAGCQYFVRKPYDPNALLLLIESAIGESRHWEMV
ncbi:MAG: response regulator [Pirellulales bacterium]|nr:response regulator [Pirellulales bacterium]